jgi:hypothetical protein
MTYDSSFTGIIGVAQEDITPPVGIYARNWGAATHDVAEGVHRPLKLTCITLKEAEKDKPLVLISADLGWWKSAADEKELRGAILETFQLEPSRLMFCLSHTHAGPGLFSEDANKPGGEYIIPYLKYIKDKAILAIQAALGSAAVATLSWRYGKCDLATNRDLPEGKGERLLVGFNPDQQADDTLLVGRITNAEGKTTGTIVNYACHPTTLAWDNRLISPDYIGAMRELLEDHNGAPCLFLQGASGELAPSEQYSGDCQLADGYGRQLGYVALGVLEAMYPANYQLKLDRVVESGAPLAVWKKQAREASTKLGLQMINIPLALKELPSLTEIESQWRECKDHVLKERLWRMRGIRKTVGHGDVSMMPLWIWRVGEAFLVGQPNEAYSYFQQEVRQALSPNAVAVMNIVNGYAGYLPPRELYAKNMYAVWQTPFASGALEQLTTTTIVAAKELMK